MKLKSILLFIIIIALITSACTYQNKVEKRIIGKYVVNGVDSERLGWIMIEEDRTFVFNRGNATSYRPEGTYKVKQDKLILSVNDDEVYYFKINGDSLIFESGEMAEELIDIGTVYELIR